LKTLRDLFEDSDSARSTEAQVAMVQAYADVFNGRGDKIQAEVVLMDILKASGYYHTTPIGTTSVVLHEAEGARRVGAHILNRLSVDIATLRAAGSAVGRESRLDAQKGEL
jgi:hypothetical protein